MIKKLFKLFTFFIFLLLIVFGISYFLVQKHLNEKLVTSKILFIPKGSTKSVLNYLDKNGIKMKNFDYYLLKFYGFPQAGWIDLKATTLTRGDFYYKITHSKAAVREIILIPGETKELFFKDVATKMDLNQTRLLNFYDEVAPYEDGVILANTYSVPIGINEKKLVSFLVQNSLDLHQKYAKKHLKEFDQKSWFLKYVTMASIITKEAASDNEMPFVSAVIHNRVKKNMPLQMDGTLNYKYQSHKKVTAKMIRQDNSVYNTYKNIGLPPHPICAVTEIAIKAAINPADVNYLYFVKSKNGKHSFTDTYKKHLSNINKLKSVKK